MIRKITYDFHIVNKNQQSAFVKDVIDHYFDKFPEVGKTVIPSEMDIFEQMIETLENISLLEIFEDEFLYKSTNTTKHEYLEEIIEGNYDLFVMDITKVLHQNKLLYYHDHCGEYFNYPLREVW